MGDWRPSSGPAAAASRAAVQRRLRSYFERNAVMEVDTPALSPYAVSDTQIESLAVTSTLSAAPLYLHTSPEICMKRLLAAGYPDIYSISRVFRDGEAGRNHQPEFTLVEWYRLGMSMDDIILDTAGAIFAALADRIDSHELVVLEYLQALSAACGLDPLSAPIDDLAGVAGADDHLRAAMGDVRDDWLDLLLTRHVIPGFAPDRLTVLRHYPASQAALARRCPGNPDLADRFEVFLGERELANGYVELTDANEQADRIERDQRDRSARGRAVRPGDRGLIAALEHGLPACAGVAMGLERLQMVYDRTDDIRDVVTFAFGDIDD